MIRPLNHLTDMDARSCFWLFIAAHTVVWTLFPFIAGLSGSLHHDMTEAWSWGQEFQLGYYKHPPLFAWIAGLWFHILPRQALFFDLLAALNVAVGLIGVWHLAGRFLSGWTRLAAVLLLALTPFYNLLAINYNANAILLSTWPWAAYFFVRAVDSGRTLDGALFGAMTALVLLGKYFSDLLIVAFFVASLLHPDARRVYRSPAPYAAILVFLLVMAPHVWWGVSNGWPPVHHAAQYLDTASGKFLWRATVTLSSSIGLLGLAAVALVVCFGNGTLAMLRKTIANLARRKNVWLVVLAFGPFVLTLLCGLTGVARISTRFMIPVFFMMPIVLLIGVDISRGQFRKIAGIWAIVAIAALVLSPIAAIATVATQSDTAREPRRELAMEVTRLWHEKFGVPLRVASASQAYGHSVAFYSEDSPSEFIDLRFDRSPWVSPARIRREGLLVACLAGDQTCLDSATRFATPDSCRFNLTLAHEFLGRQAPAATFDIFMIPPSGLTCQASK